MTLRAASLCSGYLGLDLAVDAVLGTELAWVADNDQGAAKILAHHCPDVPNLGDITQIDWSAVEPVDVLTAGFPCQDISCAGKRAGLREGNRSGLWFHVARAIDELRPSLVVIENVKELLSEYADSDMEPCTWCLGDSGDQRAMRALGAVLADLATLGFDAEWTSIPAAGVGCCHLRCRVFLVAWPAADAHRARRREVAGSAHGDENADVRGCPQDDYVPVRTGPEQLSAAGPALADTEGDGQARLVAITLDRGGDARRRPGPGDRLTAADAERDTGGQRAALTIGGPRDGTPAAGDSPERSGGGRSRNAPADTESDGWHQGRPEPARVIGGSHAPLGCAEDAAIDWREYGPAIRRHEAAFGTTAPWPVEPGRNGPRLAAGFVEWMMGLPAGWVTGVPGLSRNAQLKAIGNGVVPQQAAVALSLLLDRAFGIGQAAA